MARPGGPCCPESRGLCLSLSSLGVPCMAAVPCGQRGLVTAKTDCRLAPNMLAGRGARRCLRGALLPTARLRFGLLVAGASRPCGVSAVTSISTYSVSSLSCSSLGTALAVTSV